MLPFQRRVRSARHWSRSTAMMTSSNRQRSSDFRSRSVVVDADQTLSRSVPSANSLSRSIGGVACCFFCWRSTSALVRSRRRCSHSASNPRATRRLSGPPRDSVVQPASLDSDVVRLGDGLINLHATDIQTIDASTIAQYFARAMIARCRVGSSIMLTTGLTRLILNDAEMNHHKLLALTRCRSMISGSN